MKTIAEMTDKMVCGEPGPNLYMKIAGRDVRSFEKLLSKLKIGSYFRLSDIDKAIANSCDIKFHMVEKIEKLGSFKNRNIDLYFDKVEKDKLVNAIFKFENDINYTYFYETDDVFQKCDFNVIFEFEKYSK